MNDRNTNAGMLVLRRTPAEPITDPVEARRVITADVMKRARQARSHFHVVPKEDRTWIKPGTGEIIVFASLHEMKNHIALYEQEQQGLISNLKRQVWYDLKIGGFLITRYRSDHEYFDHTLGKKIVADSKGKRTELFIVKSRLMKLIYGIDVIEM